MRNAVVNAANLVTKIVFSSSDSMSSPPAGSTYVACGTDVAPGWTYDSTKKTFSAPIVVQTLVGVESNLLYAVDDTREQMQMLVLTPGGAKKMVYNSKQGEYQDYTQLGSSAVALLNSITLTTRFPYASREASLSGDTLAVVMARIGAGITAAVSEAQRVEAIAQTGKRRIKAATTIAAKQAAFAAINWNWGK